MRWIDRQLRNLIALVVLTAAAGALAQSFPSSIALPNGWLPEGIVTGRGPVIYSGSRGTGGITWPTYGPVRGRFLWPDRVRPPWD